jgi:hypothetical protein
MSVMIGTGRSSDLTKPVGSSSDLTKPVGSSSDLTKTTTELDKSTEGQPQWFIYSAEEIVS